MGSDAEAPTNVSTRCRPALGLAARFARIAATMREDILFEARTPLGFTVRVSRAYWAIITTRKHPAMAGHEVEVRETLESPEEIRRSRRDAGVYLFYRVRNPGRWVCAVARQEDGTGFLITTYPTDAIKEGERIWPS